MLNTLFVKRGQASGRYDDMFDVAEVLEDRCGSVPNALIQMLRESPTFQETLKKLRNGAGRSKVKRTTSDASDGG